jgi:hypothetical protein
MACQGESASIREKRRMKTYEIHGISEAKKAPFKVALGTEAFLASESTFISPGFIFPPSATAASK